MNKTILKNQKILKAKLFVSIHIFKSILQVKFSLENVNTHEKLRF